MAVFSSFVVPLASGMEDCDENNIKILLEAAENVILKELRSLRIYSMVDPERSEG